MFGYLTSSRTTSPIALNTSVSFLDGQSLLMKEKEKKKRKGNYAPKAGWYPPHIFKKTNIRNSKIK